MPKLSSFGNSNTFEQRLQESRTIIAKYKTRVPVIDYREIFKHRFAHDGKDKIPCSWRHVSRAIHPHVNNTLPQSASLMGSIYETSKEEDGFLYMYYSTENTFG